jgi:hypothetical protein
MRVLSAAGAAGVVLMAWPGAGCADGATECDGTVDCGSAVEVRWSPGELEVPAQARLCVDGVCNESTPPYANPNGDLHAPPLDGPLPDGAVTVELQLLDQNGAVLQTLGTRATVVERCTCRNIHLTVEDGELRSP